MVVSEASARGSRGATTRRALRIAQIGLVGLITLGVATQAVLAGQFISGVSNALPTHGAVAGLLELTALLLLGVAIAHRAAGGRSRAALPGSVSLALAVNVQAGLGWAPGAVPTAIHVPLGVAIFAAASILLVTLVRRRATTPATDLPPVVSATAEG